MLLFWRDIGNWFLGKKKTSTVYLKKILSHWSSWKLQYLSFSKKKTSIYLKSLVLFWKLDFLVSRTPKKNTASPPQLPPAAFERCRSTGVRLRPSGTWSNRFGNSQGIQGVRNSQLSHEKKGPWLLRDYIGHDWNYPVMWDMIIIHVHSLKRLQFTASLPLKIRQTGPQAEMSSSNPNNTFSLGEKYVSFPQGWGPWKIESERYPLGN